ncbi:hypothetical protein F6X53_18120 [Methylobacterium soli]|jgi:hypothetical protein|uniref:Uncharacterized protein n=1 Tax=Methylobacterium soli TaxID=553447 RepID=A0A6L3SWC6_9HYPH|nr:hypothetical protein [Methylobacterium soli]KAB1077645.1 hypothetical protein F6X53_18120 [Methylobacterium soli]GJE41782.1 hypothetical protein AEGHOMDF_0948 [Methylobacterium soli]
MTNREMARGAAAGAARAPQPNTQPLPPMPAPEDSATPTTDVEPIDSPQPNASVKRDPPAPGRPGLATERD